jgi:hypothetical protein
LAGGRLYALVVDAEPGLAGPGRGAAHDFRAAGPLELDHLGVAQDLQAQLQGGALVVGLTQPRGVSAGIVPWHTYTVTKVYRSGNIWYVTLRNPWGRADDASSSGSLLDRVPDGYVTLPWQVVVANLSGFASAARAS